MWIHGRLERKGLRNRKLKTFLAWFCSLPGLCKAGTSDRPKECQSQCERERGSHRCTGTVADRVGCKSGDATDGTEAVFKEDMRTSRNPCLRSSGFLLQDISPLWTWPIQEYTWTSPWYRNSPYVLIRTVARKENLVVNSYWLLAGSAYCVECSGQHLPINSQE